jgi:hypothetical protein
MDTYVPVPTTEAGWRILNLRIFHGEVGKDSSGKLIELPPRKVQIITKTLIGCY